MGVGYWVQNIRVEDRETPYNIIFLLCVCLFSLQEERRLSGAIGRGPPTAAAAQETPFGLYGPPAAYAPGYF